MSLICHPSLFRRAIFLRQALIDLILHPVYLFVKSTTMNGSLLRVTILREIPFYKILLELLKLQKIEL